MLLGNWTEAMQSAEQVRNIIVSHTYYNIRIYKKWYRLKYTDDVIQNVFCYLGFNDGQKVYQGISSKGGSAVSNLSI